MSQIVSKRSINLGQPAHTYICFLFTYILQHNRHHHCFRCHHHLIISNEYQYYYRDIKKQQTSNMGSFNTTVAQQPVSVIMYLKFLFFRTKQAIIIYTIKTEHSVKNTMNKKKTEKALQPSSQPKWQAGSQSGSLEKMHLSVIVAIIKIQLHLFHVSTAIY